MSVVELSKRPSASVVSQSAAHSPPNCARFHLYLAISLAATFVASLLMCWAYSVHIGRVFLLQAGIVLTRVGGYCPLPTYWHDKKRVGMREAALVVPWLILIATFVGLPVEAVARTAFPLQDATFVRIDGWFGINIAELAVWCRQHPIGMLVNRCYTLMLPLLLAGVFIPALTGRWKAARTFLLANIVAFGIGTILFGLMPAVGPWYGEHFLPLVDQATCQRNFLAMRSPGAYIYNPDAAGVVSFPSFHTIWAVLCAYALWSFRYLRLPAAIIAALIIVSTMTTGWHYFADVAAGVILAVVSLSLASRLQP